MNLEQSNCDDVVMDDVSIRCSEPSLSIIPDDDDDDNFEFSCLTGESSECSYVHSDTVLIELQQIFDWIFIRILVFR